MSHSIESGHDQAAGSVESAELLSDGLPTSNGSRHSHHGTS